MRRYSSITALSDVTRIAPEEGASCDALFVTNMNAGERAFFDRFKAWKHRPKDYRPTSDGDPTPQTVYAELMKQAFSPALRASGLRGSGGRFELPSDKYWAQLGFQKSAFSDSNALKFTVNLSVIDRATWTEQISTKPYLGKQPTPTNHYGTWAEQIRIGKLMPGGEDKWWWLRRGDDQSLVTEQVVSALVELAVPWLVARTAE